MHIVPRIDRAERRNLMRTGRKANDLATMLRFYATAPVTHMAADQQAA